MIYIDESKISGFNLTSCALPSHVADHLEKSVNYQLAIIDPTQYLLNCNDNCLIDILDILKQNNIPTFYNMRESHYDREEFKILDKNYNFPRINKGEKNQGTERRFKDLEKLDELILNYLI